MTPAEQARAEVEAVVQAWCVQYRRQHGNEHWSLEDALIARLTSVFERAQDDPALDCTDAAHPAWWRGNDAGVRAFAHRMHDTLCGRDDGKGVRSDAFLEAVRREALALRERAERSHEEVTRQKAEIGALTGSVEFWQKRAERAEAEVAALRAEYEVDIEDDSPEEYDALLAENRRLRRAVFGYEDTVAHTGHPEHLAQRLKEYMDALAGERDRLTAAEADVARLREAGQAVIAVWYNPNGGAGTDRMFAPMAALRALLPTPPHPDSEPTE